MTNRISIPLACHWAILTLNFLCLLIWAKLVNIELVEPRKHALDPLSVQLAVLELTIVVIAAVFAILGFIGYKNIKEAAVEAAVEAANREVQLRLNYGERPITQQNPTTESGEITHSVEERGV